MPGLSSRPSAQFRKEQARLLGVFPASSPQLHNPGTSNALFYTGIFFAREYFVWMVLFLKFVLTLGFGLVILALL